MNVDEKMVLRNLKWRTDELTRNLGESVLLLRLVDRSMEDPDTIDVPNLIMNIDRLSALTIAASEATAAARELLRLIDWRAI